MKVVQRWSIDMATAQILSFAHVLRKPMRCECLVTPLALNLRRYHAVL